MPLSDLTVPGAQLEVYVNCWCDLGLSEEFKDLYKEYEEWEPIDCCVHPDW